MSGRNGLCERLPAWMHSDGEPPHYERLKPELLGALKGEVLEIGAGSGVNLKYYRDNVRWTGIEPNTFLHQRLRQRASGLGIAMVDERWKRFFSRSPKRAGRPPSLSEIEVLTLTILARWPRWRSERGFWRFADVHLRGRFPNLLSQVLNLRLDRPLRRLASLVIRAISHRTS